MKYIYIICLGVLILLASCSKSKESIIVTGSDLTESVYASGKVKAIDQYNVYPTVNGVLQNITVKVGENVEAGQTIVELDNITSELNAENARVALELSAENSRKGSDKLQEIELSVNVAFEKLKLDSILFIRQKNLWEQSASTRLEFDQKKLNYDNSLLNYQSAKSKLAQLKTQLQNELKRASINYDINKKLQSDFSIKSTLKGKVYDILKERGELVTPQTLLAVIGKADTFLLELEVDENDIIKINIGQVALITMDSYKGEVLEAVIDKIYPIMDVRTRTFSVEAHFVRPPEKLFPNLTVEANIVIQTKKNIITVPNNYIIDKKYVLVNNDERREIKIGLRDYQKSEVIEGLKANETIYKP
ncbi:MAG: efflux RND transporter periplasmic adaptor subunit [Bacteroidetes bacterium]|nr:efflux RND transporter periplasmic adaptor subunit [Bacteroidota bacterium]